MASDETVDDTEATETDVLSATEVSRPLRKPFYKDPLSIIGWGIALASIVAYWYFFVRKPVPKPGQQIARLTGVEGKVKVKPNAKEAWASAGLSEQLHVGDVVQTETRAGAEISFNSGSVVKVRSDSVVYIGGSAEASTAAWRVQSGRVNFSVADEATEIVTPTVRTTALENATGNIDVGEGGQTGVKIFQGQAEIETTQGQKITLQREPGRAGRRRGRAGRHGRAAAAPDAHRARPPKSRLPIATRARPVRQAVVDRGQERRHLPRRARLQRDPGQPADVRGARGVRASAAPPTTSRASTSGRYFWRVAAVNKDGIEGAFSRVSHFQVVEPETPQPVADARRRRRRRPRSWCRRSTRSRPASSTSAAGPRAARR